MRILVYLYYLLMLVWTFWLFLLFLSLSCNQFAVAVPHFLSVRDSMFSLMAAALLLDHVTHQAHLVSLYLSLSLSRILTETEVDTHLMSLAERDWASRKHHPLDLVRAWWDMQFPEGDWCVFVCCTFTPLFHSTIKKKVFGVKNTCLSWFLHFSQNKQVFFTSCKLKPVSSAVFYNLKVECSSRGSCRWERERCRALPLSFLLWLWMHWNHDMQSCCGGFALLHVDVELILTWFFPTFRRMSEIHVFKLPDVSYNTSSFSFAGGVFVPLQTVRMTELTYGLWLCVCVCVRGKRG